MGNHQRISQAVAGSQVEDDDEGITDETTIIVTDSASFILVGYTWVNADEILAVGPLSILWTPGDLDECGEEIEEPVGGVCVQINSQHDDTQFVQSETDEVNVIMTRLAMATSE